MARFILCILATTVYLLGTTNAVYAHASEGGFVLLLPTGLYITGGAISVFLTVILILFIPDTALKRLFSSHSFPGAKMDAIAVTASILSTLSLFALIWFGYAGRHNPLQNPLPLVFWGLGWVVLITLQGLLGDLWRFLNPWTGLYRIFQRIFPATPVLRLAPSLEYWPGLGAFLGFAGLLLAYPAPTDPERLATLITVYWALHMLGMILFGERWLHRCEGITVLMGCYARIGAFTGRAGRVQIGLPGWQLVRRGASTTGLAVFMIVLLGVGSFDGLNETFWWFGKIGVNPLEFPGRSEVIVENLVGLLIACTGLTVGFGLSVWLGMKLAGGDHFLHSFRALAPAILPIALGYHFGHYLPGFLVDGQYLLKTLSDPLFRGNDFLGFADHYVTTGFFNTKATVRVIWLCQAGSVVTGHIIAILVSHGIATGIYRDKLKAIQSQIPLSIFMIFYTVFGLWLLASPRGV